jgi:hypothetical protein
MTEAPENPLAALRRFARPRRDGPICELCASPMAAEHEHLVEPASRRLFCCCQACAILFEGGRESRYRRVPHRIVALGDLELSDLQWESLHLPIQLAFFFKTAREERVLAFYPSPAGATESLLPLAAWQELESANPVLGELEPDVEALLVNRVGQSREYYRVPIDLCYKLVGLLRSHWRGLSGGTEAWHKIRQFFDELQASAIRTGVPPHARIEL